MHKSLHTFLTFVIRSEFATRIIFKFLLPQPPENSGPGEPADEASSRLSVECREPRNRPLAQRRSAAGVDLPTLRCSTSPESLCPFQLCDVRNSPGSIAREDRSAAPGATRLLLRNLPRLIVAEKTSPVGTRSEVAREKIRLTTSLPPKRPALKAVMA